MKKPRFETTFQGGQKVDDYILIKPLGCGQDGEVWCAESISLHRKSFAIKFLNNIDEPNKKKRFESEIKILCELNHPYIVSILGRGTAWNPKTNKIVPYYVMEFLKGASLDKFFSNNLITELNIVFCYLFRQAIVALIQMHSEDITHGDLKSANIFVLPQEQIIKITDFGFGLFKNEVSIGREEYPDSSFHSPKGLSKKGSDIHKLGMTFKHCFDQIKLKLDSDIIVALENIINSLIKHPETIKLENIKSNIEKITRESVIRKSINYLTPIVSNEILGHSSYHFIGIGGIGMSGLAELLVLQGAQVSGSDLSTGFITRRLEALGVVFHQGHRTENLRDDNIVVYSAAVKEDNPELAAARARGLTVLRRGEMLARLMENHSQVAVTGTHGKTTATAMVTSILQAENLDPTVSIGAFWNKIGSNALLGRGKYFVAEADLGDGSFSFLKPQRTIITNIDRKTPDHYRDNNNISDILIDYLGKLPIGSRIIACLDDPHIRRVIKYCPHELITYSLHAETADFWPSEIHMRGLGVQFLLFYRGLELGNVILPLVGYHNVLNAMGACAAAHSMGLDFKAWREGLSNMGGINRHCQVKGEARGILVVDDCGAHPSEIQATLRGLALGFPGRRLVVVFQPHRYSRALLPDFFPAFARTDIVFVTEIYGAGEPRLNRISGRAVFKGISKTGHPEVHFIEDSAAMSDHLLSHLKSGDLVLTLGAGDIWKTGEELLARLYANKG